MTQKQNLIELMRKNEWICSTEFQSAYLPEFRSLIARMRKHEGYQIIDESCLGRCGKSHNSKGLKRWKLVSEPDQNGGTFIASNERKSAQIGNYSTQVKSFPSGGKSGECCASSTYYRDKQNNPIHSRDCISLKVAIPERSTSNQMNF